MSKAIKCDRCGTCFDPGNANGMFTRFGDPVFLDSDDAKKGVFAFTLNDRLIPENTDLCPKCTYEFMEFMNTFGRYQEVMHSVEERW
jgi:hypothetical protein